MTSKDLQTVELSLNILGYQDQEAGEWVALALEMDLRGYGPTFEAALEDLKDLVGMQISFALQKGLPDMIVRPAEPVWFELFASVRSERMRHLGVASTGDEYQIAGLAIPPAHVIASRAGEFTPSNAPS